jgi:hypothetical protein
MTMSSIRVGRAVASGTPTRANAINASAWRCIRDTIAPSGMSCVDRGIAPDAGVPTPPGSLGSAGAKV